MENPDKKIARWLGAEALRMPVAKEDCRKLMLSAFIFASLNSCLRWMQRILYRKASGANLNILVFRTGSLGDSLCITPSLFAIRNHYPGSKITILANTGIKSLVSPDKVIHPALYDNMIDYLGMGRRSLVKELRARKFDLVIQLPQVDANFWRLLRDLFFFRFVAPAGWGWRLSRILIHRRLIEKYIFYPNEALRLLWLCEQNGLGDNPLDFRLNFGDEDRQAVDRFFAEHQLQDQKVLAIAVGANSVKNRWPIEYFAALIHHFRKTMPVLLIGGPDDNKLVADFDGLEGVYNCCGRFTPMQSGLVIKKCALAITNDTGPLHLSYAVGTPLIGLFASRDFYGKWFPPTTANARVFRTPDVDCSLCFAGPCNYNNICMKAIQPSSVIQAAEEMMAV